MPMEGSIWQLCINAQKKPVNTVKFFNRENAQF